MRRQNIDGLINTYADISLIPSATNIFLHYIIDDSFFVPPGPDTRLRAENIVSKVFLILSKLLEYLLLALQATVFHHLHVCFCTADRKYLREKLY